MSIEYFFRTILETLPHLVLVTTPVTVPETDRREYLIEYVNSAWERLSGSRADTVLGKYFSQTIYHGSSIPWDKLVMDAMENGKSEHQSFYSDLVDKWLDVTVTRLEPNHACLHVVDVTELKQGEMRLKEQNLRLSSLSAELAASKNNLKVKLEKIENLNANLEQLAYYDHLTELPNRTRFTAILGEELESANRSGNRFALAILDVDNLKTLNDSMGHEAGDQLLKQMSRRLAAFGKNDILASRFGGDEFLLVIHNYEHDAELLHLINDIQKSLSEPYQLLNAEIKSSVSIGATVFPDDAQSVQDLLKYADIAMTDAKRRGKNTLSLFHSVMQDNLLARLNLEQKMASALEGLRFRLFYQPQYTSESRRIRGFEALVRWFDRDLGEVSPDRFIPIAEETRIIIPLGEWILRTACQTLREWQERYGFDGIMSVNVSPIQLRHSAFVDSLRAVLEETGIAPETLELEITEGILIDNFKESIKILESIKDLGVGISLDDFGTGYSSLCYLQFLPLTTLKIDKSFIANITRDKSVEYEITDAIVNLMNKLGLDTIAEGVETDEQLAMIKRVNCKTVQGFLTGRPMSREDCELLLNERAYVSEASLETDGTLYST